MLLGLYWKSCHGAATGIIDAALPGGKACLSIRKHNHFTPAREIRRNVRTFTARNRPEGRY